MEKQLPILMINHRRYNSIDSTRNNNTDFCPAEMVIDSNFAIFSFHACDVAPDDKHGGWADKLLQMYLEQLYNPNGMRELTAYAGVVAPVMDYSE